MIKIKNFFKRIGDWLASDSEIDFTTGHIYKKMWLFIIPFILTSVLQLVYTTVDQAIVSNPFLFGGDASEAQAAGGAVGGNGTLITFCTGLFVGIGTAANIVIARAKGKGDKDYALKSMASALVIAVIVGIALGIFGFFMTPTLLKAMNVEGLTLDYAIVYMRCYFIGVPFFMIFNFGASILRALGDSRRPMFTLILTSFVNIALSFLFVGAFKMKVFGIGLALIICELVSAVVVVFYIFKSKGFVSLSFKDLRLHKHQSIELLREGLIIGSQAILFGVCTVLVSARFNEIGKSYGELSEWFYNANAASANLEDYIYLILNAFSFACLTMISQNAGALKKDNIRKIYRNLLLTAIVVGLVLGGLMMALYRPLFSIFHITEERQLKVIAPRYFTMIAIYFICPLQEIGEQRLRGLDHNKTATLISLFGGVGFRLIYVLAIYDLIPGMKTGSHNVFWLTLSYPACWLILFISFHIGGQIKQKKDFIEIDKKIAEQELNKNQKEETIA